MRALPDYRWTLKTQPARHFSWRVEASGWIWGLGEDADFEQSYDLIIATSLSGLAGLRALRPALAAVPTWVYFHENQFAHPLESRQQTSHQVGWQFASFQNALCGDWVSFNTAFNRDSFFEGLKALLKKVPECLPGDPAAALAERSDVLHVPLTSEFSALRPLPKERDLIVWNHRWEWDKQPERFLQALLELQAEGQSFRLAMLGCGGGADNRFAAERTALGAAVVRWGEADRGTYRQWMGRAGIAVSCALHDFQGLAVLEAAQAGAVVVVPKRVAYPECVPGALFYEGSAANAAEDVASLKAALREALSVKAPSAVPLLSIPEWPPCRAAYAARIERLLELGRERTASTRE